MTSSREEPAVKRCIAFVDAPGLHRALQSTFIYNYPNFDPKKLAEEICQREGWELKSTRLYTFSPTEQQNKRWYNFWRRKSNWHEDNGVVVKRMFWRESPRLCPIYDETGSLVGNEIRRVYGHEELVVRMVLDVASLFYDDTYDVALFFSRDPALTQVVRDLRNDAETDGTWLKFASAVPYENGPQGFRGVNETDWIHFNHDMYVHCIDKNDYRYDVPKDNQGTDADSSVD
jgi:uncharacterized LabA/DUF88 family protein